MKKRKVHRRHVEYKTAVGRNIRETRIQKGISQKELAQRVGVSTQWIGQIERGVSTPGFKLLRDIARELGTTASDLAKGQD